MTKLLFFALGLAVGLSEFNGLAIAMLLLALLLHWATRWLIDLFHHMGDLTHE